MKPFTTIAVVMVTLTTAPTVPTALAQQCRDDIPATSPTEQYRVTDDVMVTDLKHQRMWLRCSVGQQWEDGQCRGDPVTTSHDQALNLAKQHDDAGYTDWRLPTIYELSTLAELRCHRPAINLDVFPDTPAADYWTSTLFSNNANMAWLVHFQYGENHTAMKSSKAKVRLVRSIAP
ncbi:MAG: DUF1566 domain-containing protein [Gammaproteobacteria bacterium]|jgi:hypothetical protein